jgi:hypothetical protein
MKLSKTALLVLGIGVFIIAFATLFSISSGQKGEQAQISDNLATAQSLLPKLIAEREDLEGQLANWESEVAEATSSLSKSEARYPKTVESIENDETLFLMADECDLLIRELTASEPADKEVKSEEVEDIDITYAVTTFEVVVRSKESPPSTAGDFELYIDEFLANVLDFIHIIATSEEFNIGTINLVTIENLEPPEEVEEGGTGPEATIDLIIYGFPR